MSIRIRFGCSSRASVSPASASVALRTACPADCRRNTARVMFAGLSSTMRTFAISGCRLATRDGPPDFSNEAVGVERALFHDRHDVAIQLVAVLDGDLLG